MDETNQTNQDEKITSGEKGGTTSKQVTLTPEDYQKLKSDAEASKGRAEKASTLEKEVTRLTDELNAKTKSIDELNSRLNQIELDKVKDDPDKLKIYQSTQQADSIKREAETLMNEAKRLKAEADAERQQIVKDQFNFSTGYVASKYKLDANRLEETAKGLGISEPAKLEILAQQMSGKVVTQTASWSPDSGVGETGSTSVIRGDESPRQLISEGIKEKEN